MSTAHQKITKVSRTHRKSNGNKHASTKRVAYKRSGNAKKSAVRI